MRETVKTKPILFSAPMVQAILDGKKSMTRRVVKPQPDSVRHSVFAKSGIESCHGYEIKTPYVPGDTLYVKETWKCVKYDNMDGNLGYGVEFKDGTRKYFEFDDNERFHQFGKYATKNGKNGWQSPYFMPRETARIFLVVRAVRVERLQDITEEDAKTEGSIKVQYCLHPYDRDGIAPYEDEAYGTHGQGFQALWDSLYTKHGYGWETNPWVWAISFARVDPEEVSPK